MTVPRGHASRVRRVWSFYSDISEEKYFQYLLVGLIEKGQGGPELDVHVSENVRVSPSGSFAVIVLIDAGILFVSTNNTESVINGKKLSVPHIFSGRPSNISVWSIIFLRLASWVKTTADDILKPFSYFPQKIGFGMSCKLFS